MTTPLEAEIKRQVRQFYDQVGWQEAGEGYYQNARYEDLRPVSQEYIRRCHLRVARHLAPQGRLLLDAGSGPIQYAEYLEYSRGYQARLCADISIVALKEARRRIGDRQQGGHGLFVVMDVANLPFPAEAFDGVVSLHTIHHLPLVEHRQAYLELFRVLASGRTAVVVNGWDNPPLMRLFNPPIRWINRLRAWLRRKPLPPSRKAPTTTVQNAKGTFVSKNNAAWFEREIGSALPVEILVWRSVSVRFMRTFVSPHLGGRSCLRLLFWLEERFPHFFGENGQYPLIVLRKSQTGKTQPI
ncbi:MAG TPA: class I SAM-dependent methyltransferase [Anaerolineales bacterium]|nr:class I SAM-dependent methyltransferase [Anaerolineales bacterium]